MVGVATAPAVRILAMAVADTVAVVAVDGAVSEYNGQDDCCAGHDTDDGEDQ